MLRTETECHILCISGGRVEKDRAYMLKTDRMDMTADEAWRTYTMLTRAENAFRAMKSPLAERPIFHHLEHRVEAHIFLCVLAYHILTAVELTLCRNGLHTSRDRPGNHCANQNLEQNRQK